MSPRSNLQCRDKTFSVIVAGQQHQFDSFEAAIGALAACGVFRADDDSRSGQVRLTGARVDRRHPVRRS